MAGRTLYIEDHDDDATPISGCSCAAPRTYGECDPVTDGVLTPGDPSPCGRCPECDELVYLDRPEDRAVDAARDVAWAARRAAKPEIEVPDALEKMAASLTELTGLAITITIA
jgi:hypothetical protein